MSVDLKQIDLSTMTWREIFSVIEDNFNTVISAILARSTECTMEQFRGGSYTYTISQVIDDDTTLLVFKGNQYIGGRTGTGYTYASQVLTFTEAVDSDDMISVMMLHSDALANLSANYVSQIKTMYDSLVALNIDVTKTKSEVDATHTYIEQVAYDLFNAYNKSLAVKTYIENLISTTKPTEGSIISEVTAARRTKDLLGERLDAMPFLEESVESFKSQTMYQDGDSVIILTSMGFYLVVVHDTYTGTLSTIKLNNGKVAAIYYETETVKEQLKALLTETKEYSDSAKASADKFTVDTLMSDSSLNPVENKVITEALAKKQDAGDYVTASTMNTELGKKQDTLTFDTAPTADSKNPVTSSGVKKAIDDITPAIATLAKAGLIKPDGTTTTVDEDGTLVVKQTGTYSAKDISYNKDNLGVDRSNVQTMLNYVEKEVNGFKAATTSMVYDTSGNLTGVTAVDGMSRTLKTTLTYSSGNLTSVVETMKNSSGTLLFTHNVTLTYTNGSLSGVVEEVV